MKRSIIRNSTHTKGEACNGMTISSFQTLALNRNAICRQTKQKHCIGMYTECQVKNTDFNQKSEWLNPSSLKAIIYSRYLVIDSPLTFIDVCCFTCYILMSKAHVFQLDVLL